MGGAVGGATGRGAAAVGEAGVVVTLGGVRRGGRLAAGLAAAGAAGVSTGGGESTGADAALAGAGGRPVAGLVGPRTGRVSGGAAAAVVPGPSLWAAGGGASSGRRGRAAGSAAGATGVGGAELLAACAASASLTNTTRGEKMSPRTRPLACRRTSSRALSVPRNSPLTSASPTSACAASTCPPAPTVSRPLTCSGPPSKRPSIRTSPSAVSWPTKRVPAARTVLAGVIGLAQYHRRTPLYILTSVADFWLSGGRLLAQRWPVSGRVARGSLGHDAQLDALRWAVG